MSDEQRDWLTSYIQTSVPEDWFGPADQWGIYSIRPSDRGNTFIVELESDETYEVTVERLY